MTNRTQWFMALTLALAATGCSATPDGAPDDAGDASPGDASAVDGGCVQGDVTMLADGRVTGGRYASRVVSFTPGEGASFGHDQMPDVVLGPPRGRGDFNGSLDVVSLGAGGEIVLGFDVEIVDGPGDDLTVFENAFSVPGSAGTYWEELGEVSVSVDGTTWTTFPCMASGARPHTGCAGWNVVYSAPDNGLCATDPRVSGGDGFDLATVGVPSARYVRIRDLRTQGLAPPSTGFDLDAVAALHAR